VVAVVVVVAFSLVHRSQQFQGAMPILLLEAEVAQEGMARHLN
jgi:hypothetical protein